MKIYYALQAKTGFTDFTCISNSQEQFERKIQRAYWAWKGIQSKGTLTTLEGFLDGYHKVKLTVEELCEADHDMTRDVSEMTREELEEVVGSLRLAIYEHSFKAEKCK